MKIYMNICFFALLAITDGVTADGLHGTRASKAEMAERSGSAHRTKKAEMDNLNKKHEPQRSSDWKADTAERSGGDHQSKAEMAERSGGVYQSKAEMAERSIVSSASSCYDVYEWVDSGSPAYTCSDYEANNVCYTEGLFFENEGHTANTACCSCGGGSECSDVEWIDSGSPAYTCSDYEANDVCSTEGHLSDFENEGRTANSACCACGGGAAPSTCSDFSGWYDSDGETYNCAYYGSNGMCSSWGDLFENQGHTANSACCTCGGGCLDVVGWYDSAGDACNWYEVNDRCFTHGSGYENFGHTANTACCACNGY